MSLYVLTKKSQTLGLTSITIQSQIILWGLMVLLALSGCASRKSPAPIENISVKSKYHHSKTKSRKTTNYYTIKGNSYRVEKGDTLFAIAWRSGVDLTELAHINGIRDPYVIYPDQVLKLRIIPPKPSKTEASSKVSKSKQSKTKKIVAKTLADQKKGEYGHSKQEKQPSPIAHSGAKKVPNQQVAVKTYSNKIKQWVWPASGKILAVFSNKENGNKGLDIGNKSGTSIYSAADGKVVYYGDALRGYGKLIIIKHNDDYLSAYAHNRQILVKEKDFVKAGQKIAEMGDTDSANVKLHFEVRYRGKSVNPLKYLPKQ